MLGVVKNILVFTLVTLATFWPPNVSYFEAKTSDSKFADQKQLYFNYTQCFGAYLQRHFILDHNVESLPDDDGAFFWLRAMMSVAPKLERDAGTDADMVADLNDFRRAALGDTDALADAEKIISFCDKWQQEFSQRNSV